MGVTHGPVLVGASISVSTWLDHAIARRDTVAWNADADHLADPAARLLDASRSLCSTRASGAPRAVAYAFAGALLAAPSSRCEDGLRALPSHVPTYEVVYGALAALPVF
jgi:hypothetical protein